MVRRLLFAYTICHMDRDITVQIMILDFLSTFLLGYYLCCKPMVDGVNNFIQPFNECIILLCQWYLFLFTDYVPDPKLRHEFGQGFIYLIGTNFGVNGIILLYTLISSSIKKI